MNAEFEQKKGKNEYLCFLLFCALICFMTYQNVMAKMLQGGQNDFAAHCNEILPLFYGGSWWKGWMAAPHCLWHLTVLFFYTICAMPMEAAASYATALYGLFYYVVLVWVIRKLLSAKNSSLNPITLYGVAFGFYYVQALHFYWLDAGERYLGSFSMNPLHNPTQLGVRGFALIAFCIMVDMFGKWKSTEYQELFFKIEGKKPYILLTVSLFLSTIMKPTFAEVFVPAVGLLMLGELLIRLVKKEDVKDYWTKCLTMFLCALPTILYMLLQYIMFFAFGGSYNAGEGVVLTTPFQVWNLFTDNVVLSIFLGMAFPLYVLMLDYRYFIERPAGKMALLSYGIGVLEAALLGEEGSRMTHANFLWPMMSGMFLMWVVALWRFLILEQTKDMTKKQQVCIVIGWVLFIAHVICGLVFYRMEVLGL